jgi:hypothetical protein
MNSQTPLTFHSQVLMSNGSNDIYPQNTPNNFVNQLHDAFDLGSGVWYVGLSSIHFPTEFKEHALPAKRSYPDAAQHNPKPAKIPKLEFAVELEQTTEAAENLLLPYPGPVDREYTVDELTDFAVKLLKNRFILSYNPDEIKERIEDGEHVDSIVDAVVYVDIVKRRKGHYYLVEKIDDYIAKTLARLKINPKQVTAYVLSQSNVFHQLGVLISGSYNHYGPIRQLEDMLRMRHQRSDDIINWYYKYDIERRGLHYDDKSYVFKEPAYKFPHADIPVHRRTYNKLAQPDPLVGVNDDDPLTEPELLQYAESQLGRHHIVEFDMNDVREQFSNPHYAYQKNRNVFKIINDIIQKDIFKRIRKLKKDRGPKDKKQTYSAKQLIDFAEKSVKKYGVITFDSGAIQRRLNDGLNIDEIINSTIIAELYAQGTPVPTTFDFLKVRPTHYSPLPDADELEMNKTMDEMKKARKKKKDILEQERINNEAKRVRALENEKQRIIAEEMERTMKTRTDNFNEAQRELSRIGVIGVDFQELRDRIVNKGEDPDSAVHYYHTLSIEMCNIRPKCLQIYCDAVKSQLVGDCYGGYLNTVRVADDGRKTDVADWPKPDYYPVSKNYFRQMEMDIRDEKGCKVSFADGVVIATLHFKRVR